MTVITNIDTGNRLLYRFGGKGAFEMDKGFLYQKGTNKRIPYWVTLEQAEKISADQGGTINGFWMSLKGFGIMKPVKWHFLTRHPETNKLLQTYDREQWEV